MNEHELVFKSGKQGIYIQLNITEYSESYSFYFIIENEIMNRLIRVDRAKGKIQIYGFYNIDYKINSRQIRSIANSVIKAKNDSVYGKAISNSLTLIKKILHSRVSLSRKTDEILTSLFIKIKEIEINYGKEN